MKEGLVISRHWSKILIEHIVDVADDAAAETEKLVAWLLLVNVLH